MEEQNNTEMTTEQVEELYQNINQPKGPSVEDSPQPTPETYEIAEGVSATREELINYAKKGYDFDKQFSEFENQKKEYDPLIEKYKKIDEYAIQNPDWFNHVQSEFNKKLENPQDNSNNELEQGDNALPPDLQIFNSRLTKIEQLMQGQQTSQEDSALDTEIKSIRDEYSYMDFDTKDDAGKTLEVKVLEHADKIGTNSFRAAFRDFAHDKLISKAKEVGKESLGKVIEKQNKLGLLTSGSKSEIRVKKTDHKNKTYDDLLKEGLEELGIK